MKNKLSLCITGMLMSVLMSCGDSKKTEQENLVEEKKIDVPTFNADSAYFFVGRQVAFGPRVPNTTAHVKTGDYLIEKLKGYGAEVQVQNFEATTFDDQKLYLRNIIASFYPEKTKRILLAAHWDTRPFADKDEERTDMPIDGANDGASGVGVLLEVARVLKESEKKPDVGIDIIFFDGEDWGTLDGEDDKPLPPGQDSWWCLGSQYWAKNKHEAGYSAFYGILLDMVGAQGSQFHMEEVSMYYAEGIVKKVWDRAAKLGYRQYFIKSQKNGIIDDHVYVNKYAKIPMINIVHYDPAVGYFGDYHHTHKDDMAIISTETLNAVGQTLLGVIYYE